MFNPIHGPKKILDSRGFIDGTTKLQGTVYHHISSLVYKYNSFDNWLDYPRKTLSHLNRENMPFTISISQQHLFVRKYLT